MKRLALVAVLAIASVLAGASGCKKNEKAAATASGSDSASGSASGSGSAAASAAGSGAAAASGSASGAGSGSVVGSSRADVAGFLTVFEPINSKLDHVSRARTACEQRQALVDAAKMVDKNTPAKGSDPQKWLESTEALQTAIDETGDPCDNGDIKGIEAQLDKAKTAIDALAAMSP
jgi:hypothetical protein